MFILFQCNTVYQLLVALNIKIQHFNDCEADILLSDIMNDAEKIRDKLEQSGLFSNVYIQYIKNNRISKRKKIFLLSFEKKEIVNNDEVLTNNYSDIFFCNPSIENCLLIQKNKKAKIHIFEDGLATYSKYYEKLYFVHGKKKFFSYYRFINKAEDLYTFLPQAFDWTPNQKLIKINSLKNLNTDEIKKINKIFSYNNESFPADCKTIYFEEGYFGDGKEVNDIELIKKCAIKFGYDNFYIKNHPRNRINRFEGVYKCLNSMSIPWELFILNNMEKINKLNLISIASAALFTPFILFELKPNGYFLIDNINDQKYLYPFIPDVERKIASLNSNIHIIDIDKFEVKK